MRTVSDLFCEGFGAARLDVPYADEERLVHGVPVIFGEVPTGADRSGRYATLKCGSMTSAVRDPDVRQAFSQVFSELAGTFTKKKPAKMLILCLGNGNITADSVGARASERLLAGNVGDSYSAVIKTGVPMATGVHSARIASAVAKEIDADIAVCIDSLAALNEKNVCTLFQITDCGIRPGSGVASHADEISTGSLGIPVVTVGIPTAFRGVDGRIYTLAAAEEEIRCGSAVIAHGINAFLAGGG